MTILYVGLSALAAFWIWMLVDCIRRKDPPALGGSVAFARWFWLASFVLVNPLLALLYGVFVRFGALSQTRRLRDALVFTGVALAITAQFAGRGVSEDWREPPSSFAMSFDVKAWSSGSERTTRHQAESQPIALRHVRVVYDRQPVVMRAAQQLARALDSRPFVGKVECWPSDRRAEPGAPAPDYYVAIRDDTETEIALPFYHRIVARYSLTVGSQLRWYQSTPGDCSPHSLRIDGTYDVDYERYGFAYGSAHLANPSDKLADELIEAVVEAFRETAARAGALPPLDGEFDSRPSTPPAPLQGRELELLSSECPSMAHDRSCWRFVDARPTQAVLDELGPALEAAGWRRDRRYGDTQEPVLLLRRDVERLAIGRWPPLPPADEYPLGYQELPSSPNTPSPVQRSTAAVAMERPFVVRYERLFDSERLDSLRDAACNTTATIDTWLLFADRWTPAQRTEFLGLAATLTSNRALHWRRVAELIDASGDRTAAVDALQSALALLQLDETEDDEADAIEKLAEDWGVETVRPDLRRYESLGIPELPAGISVARDVALEERIRFVTQPGADFVFCAFELRGDASSPMLWVRLSKDGSAVSTTLEANAATTERFDFDRQIGSFGVHTKASATPLPDGSFRLSVTARY